MANITITGYTEDGKTIDCESARCFARKEEGLVVTRYYVKRSNTGIDAGQFLNPWGMNFNKGQESAYASSHGMMRYTFIKVKEEVFNHYMKFLETKNEAWLRQAKQLSIN